MAAGPVVDQIAQNFAGRPVVMLEHNFYTPQGDRENRFWSAYPESWVAFPAIMLESGYVTQTGPVDYLNVYTGLIDAELARAPQAEVHAWARRMGDTLRIYATVLNHSGMTLSSANSATITALVWDDVKVGVTSHTMRAAPALAISSLADGARASATLDTTALTGVDWTKVHALALVDYCSSWTGPCDALQAAMAADPAMTLQPQNVTLTATPAGSDPSTTVALNGPAVVNWSATSDVNWISLPAASGSLPASPSITIVKSKLANGPQQGHVTFAGTSADGLSFTSTLTVNVNYAFTLPAGDVNGDGVVNAADIFYLLNHLFAGGATPVVSGDLNGDGAVNAADVIYLLSYLFAGGTAPH